MMSKGTVSEYFPQRGFGSIVDSLTGHKLVVYANYLCLLNGNILKKGQEVEYEIEKQGGVSLALNVRFAFKQQEDNRNAAT